RHYEKLNKGSTLISYSDYVKHDSFKDKESGYWVKYLLVEYIPDRNSGREPYIEVRQVNTLKENRDFSRKFNEEYRHYIYTLSDSERSEAENLRFIDQAVQKTPPETFKSLTIWETKAKFIESLKSVKKRILIESPWIKRAALEYIPLFKELLLQKKHLVVLYGIEDAEHDYNTLSQLKDLQSKNSNSFLLIDLNEHCKLNGINFKGSHRKLLIKDDDYYISGSFNFLSFGKNKNQTVANEESILISKNVAEKWRQVEKEYRLSIIESNILLNPVLST
ncbi:MAG TPA: hypothetical protein VLJ60_02200, partial [bacterium]|nr:hypothetical protein [bacterium]